MGEGPESKVRDDGGSDYGSNREMERSSWFGICLGLAWQNMLVSMICEVRGWGNSDNSQILDVRESTDGPFPDMGITKSAVGLDSKLRSTALALESLKYLFDFPMEMGTDVFVSSSRKTFLPRATRNNWTMQEI